MGFVTILGPDDEPFTMCAVCVIEQKRIFLQRPDINQKIGQWVKDGDDTKHHKVRLEIDKMIPYEPAITYSITPYSPIPMPTCWTHTSPGPGRSRIDTGVVPALEIPEGLKNRAKKTF
jgi:hypothetical protein